MRCNRFPWIHRWKTVPVTQFDRAIVDQLGLPSQWKYRVCTRCGDGEAYQPWRTR